MRSLAAEGPGSDRGREAASGRLYVRIAGAQVSKHLLMETMDRDILAAVGCIAAAEGCIAAAEGWRKKEIKENTKIYLTQRKCAWPRCAGSSMPCPHREHAVWQHARAPCPCAAANMPKP